MRTELDYQTFKQPIVRNNAELGFEIFKNSANAASKDEPPSTIHRGSTMVSNRVLEGGREFMKQTGGSTMKKLSLNSLQLGEKLKNCKTGKTQ